MSPDKKAKAGADLFHQGVELAYWLAVILGGFAGLTIALAAPHLFVHNVDVGNVANRDLFAGSSRNIVDELATHQVRDAARHSVEPVLNWNHKRDAEMVARVSARFNESDLSQTYSTEQKSQVIESTRTLLRTTPLLPGQTQQWQSLMIELLPKEMPAHLKAKAAQHVAETLEPNIVLDSEASRERGEQAARKIAPVLRQIQKGDLIVARGETLSPDHVRILNLVGIASEEEAPFIASLCLSLLAAFILLGIFLWSYEPKHLFSYSSMGLMATVSVVTAGIAAFAGHQYPQFIPLPAAALVLSIFLGTRVSCVLILLLTVFLYADGLVRTTDLICLVTASLFAFGAPIRDRQHLMLRGVLIGISQAAAYLAIVLLTQSATSVSSFIGQLFLQLLGGLSSAIVAIGSLPFLENIFGLVTPFRLAELTDPTQPLLRQLEERAPGTYQHSLAVANLAEAGAKAIGADANLARTGSLYHDIGKLVRPVYFIENQLGNKNPHDDITPEESRDRVLAHVTDGLTLAHKYGLPKLVQDFIPQHQGTTVMAYFYHKACLRDGIENVDVSFYRYPGPKPQSKEAAIVMLADVSEAVTHSMRDPSEEEVESAIGAVFKARYEDGQFSETGMSIADLEKVKKAFVRVWRTLHHDRLKYPSTTTGRMPVPPNTPPGIDTQCC